MAFYEIFLIFNCFFVFSAPFGGGTRQQALRSPEESRPRRYVSADIFFEVYWFLIS